jgi:hypothetical protein
MSSNNRLKSVSHREGKNYEPTVRDIRRACASIREGWSDQERRKRAGLGKEESWTPPRARIEFLEDEDSSSSW